MTGLLESRLSPSALGAAEVTFRTRQLFRVPWCLRTNPDDTRNDRGVVVHDGRDGGVVVVNELNSGTRNHSECVVDISRENPLGDRRVLSITHCQACRFQHNKVTLEYMVTCKESNRPYRC
ncbi:hypothetical protein LSAT2_004323 [Lamellibrachia satsuma]|nr:hypothetical protein LSAT2_004323 [Lamellibrachia satsuma]